MKIFLLIILFISNLNQSYTQFLEAPYRIFGEISTVNNQTYKGFITWGGIKNYWIDFFEANKIKNAYTHFFNSNDGIYFSNNGHTSSIPPTHIFNCRFGNIQSIRITGENEIQLELKNGETFYLVKGNSLDINTSVQITTQHESIQVKWDHISEIHFMSANDTIIPPELNQIAGIVKSSQGIYKGLITWNNNKKKSTDKNKQINIFLNKISKISKEKGEFKVMPKENLFKNSVYLKTDILYPVENIMVNMPNIGSVTIPLAQFEELEIIPLSELSLLSYTDFSLPKAIKGEVLTRHNEKIKGKLAYDLDENLNIESLDGKNNTINYRIPFKYISTIEPKNYKYSFITLQNGSQLSLGESADVNRENSGVIVFDYSDIPVYIPWNEIKKIEIYP